MNDAEFQLYESFEDDQWWFVGKRRLVRALLGEAPRGRILDLGCGMGGVLRDFEAGARCFGADRSRYALRVCRSKGATALALADMLAPPFRSDAFDHVLALDVIEHLPDDVAFLRRAGELLAPGGRLLVAVPAFPLLWSQHDVTFQHFRRYTATTLRAAVVAAGLVPERTTYLHAFVFPIAAVWRVASYRLGLGRFAPKSDFWPMPAWLNAFLASLYRAEAWWVARGDLPFGVSVACIARRGEAA
jgi:2-polyprenyl-3-methyl-5-hydroxy-6-metoxy-1,4-benzoquinol methylase